MFLESNIIRDNFNSQSKSVEAAIIRLSLTNEDCKVDENDYIGFQFKSSLEINTEFIKIILGEFEFDIIFLGEKKGTFYYTCSFEDVYPEESSFWHNFSST